MIAWFDPVKSLGYELRTPKFTLELVKYINLCGECTLSVPEGILTF